jgi:hypothetical protein
MEAAQRSDEASGGEIAVGDAVSARRNRGSGGCGNATGGIRSSTSGGPRHRSGRRKRSCPGIRRRGGASRISRPSGNLIQGTSFSLLYTVARDTVWIIDIRDQRGRRSADALRRFLRDAHAPEDGAG